MINENFGNQKVTKGYKNYCFSIKNTQETQKTQKLVVFLYV